MAPRLPQVVSRFSGVAYHFARALHTQLDVPVGVVLSSWGGTKAKAWTDIQTLAQHRNLQYLAKGWRPGPAHMAKAQAAYDKDLQIWNAALGYQDAGVTEASKKWAKGKADPAAGWRPFQVPEMWERRGLKLDGVIWFKRQINIPEAWVGRDLFLSVGVTKDCDTTYFAGTQVGASCTKAGLTHGYRVPAALVHVGAVTVAMRIYNKIGRGGFSRAGDGLYVVPWDQRMDLSQAQNIEGEWQHRIEQSIAPRKVGPDGMRPSWPEARPGIAHHRAVGGLWRGMIAPLVPFKFKGVIWYQGESDADRAFEYRTLFPTLIKDWRKNFGPKLPFYFVQLAGFRRNGQGLEETAHWNGQNSGRPSFLTHRKLSNTGLVVTTDVSTPDNIHPPDKKTVGDRLARWALHDTYGRADVVPSGPLYRGHRVLRNPKGPGRAIRVFFDHGTGLGTKHGMGLGMGLGTGAAPPDKATSAPIRGFTIAGPDRIFVHAQATVHPDGQSLLVSAPNVPNPKSTRYGWTDVPEGNLVNAAGLPASPFRTDKWPTVTKRNSP